jgi:hypothetical protein
MIKEEIRSIFRNLLPKLNKTNRWHDRVIDSAIEKVLNVMYNDVFKRNPFALQRYTKSYGYTTPLGVLLEANTGIYYTNLPVAIVPFSDKASGVRRISTIAQGGLTFIPVDAREMDLVVGSNVATTTKKIGYNVTPTRVEYYKMTGNPITDGVRMDLIIPFSVYADTDIILIPEETDQQGQTFIDKVLKILGVIQPVDLKDNNADVETTQNKGQ